MAIAKVADRGSESGTQAADTERLIDMAAAGSITTGNYLIARVAGNNSGTNGAACTLAVSDARNGSWTVLTIALRDPGAADAGAAAYIAYVKATNAYTNGDDVTFTFTPGITGHSLVIEEWSGINATSPVAVAETTASAGASQPTIARTATAADQMFYGVLAIEGGGADTYTEDTDTTNGSWVSLTRLDATGAGGTGDMRVAGAYKLVTASGAQTWNPAITQRDWAAVALVFAPSGGAVAVTGSGAVATTGLGFLLAALALLGDGEAAVTGTGSLLATMALAGHGDAATAGTADLDVVATGNAVDLDGHGDTASAGQADLVLGATLTGDGEAAVIGTADLLLGADLQGHGDIAAVDSAALLLGADLQAHGDAASVAAANLLLAAALAGDGEAANAGTADPLLAAALAGHGDIATAGTADLTVGIFIPPVELEGHGDAATAGTAELLLTADVRGHGDTATTATGDLALTADVRGDGEAAATGTASVQITASLEGHGDAATVGIADVVKQGQVDLEGQGTASSAGTGSFRLTVTFTGHGDIASAGTAAAVAALTLAGHGDIATAGQLITEAIVEAVAEEDSYTIGYRRRVITLELRFEYAAELSITATILANRHAACEGLLRSRATCSTRHATQLEALRAVESRLFTAKDRRLDDLEAKLGLLLLLEKQG